MFTINESLPTCPFTSQEPLPNGWLTITNH